MHGRALPLSSNPRNKTELSICSLYANGQGGNGKLVKFNYSRHLPVKLTEILTSEIEVNCVGHFIAEAVSSIMQ
jgi:hypothetical protein